MINRKLKKIQLPREVFDLINQPGTTDIQGYAMGDLIIIADKCLGKCHASISHPHRLPTDKELEIIKSELFPGVSMKISAAGRAVQIMETEVGTTKIDLKKFLQSGQKVDMNDLLIEQSKDIDIKLFVKERDEALLSLDKEKIIRFSKKYGVPMPKSELAFWASIHKAIVLLNSATAEQKQKSTNWLLQNGFKKTIGFL